MNCLQYYSVGLQIAAAIFAVFAGIYWYLSAKVEIYSKEINMAASVSYLMLAGQEASYQITSPKFDTCSTRLDLILRECLYLVEY